MGLFLGIGAYAVAATFLPKALSFGNPVFLAAAAVFTASTAVCAQERARAALALLRGWRDPASPAVDRLASASGAGIELAEGVSAEEALARAEAALGGLGLRQARRDDGVWARRNAWGALGSPVFHYALAGLFIFAGLGQLMKWEGVIGVPEGGVARDTPALYDPYTAGPLASHAAGRVIAVDDLDINHVHRDVERGPSPQVRLLVDGEEVRAQRVYPNRPLRYGSLSVHQLEYGIGAVLTVLGPEGEARGSAPAALHFDDLRPDGTLVVEASAEGRPAEEYAVVVAVPLDEEGGRYFRRVPEDPRVLVSFPGSGDPATERPREARVGERVALPGGSGWLVVEELGYQVWLFVVDDWTIPFIYAFLTVACVGAAVALLAPPRAAFVRHETADASAGVPARLVLVTRCRRVDPAFPGRARAAVERSVSRREDER